MKLEDLRAEIDAIDTRLLQLLAQRMEIVEKVGHLKRKNGQEGVFIRPKREDEMMKRILASGAGKFPKQALFSIWRAIISASLQVENPFKVITTKCAGKEVFDYFGSVTEYVLLDNAAQVIENIAINVVGVLPDSADLSKLPKNMRVFAKFGGYNAFAEINEDA